MRKLNAANVVKTKKKYDDNSIDIPYFMLWYKTKQTLPILKF